MNRASVGRMLTASCLIANLGCGGVSIVGVNPDQSDASGVLDHYSGETDGSFADSRSQDTGFVQGEGGVDAPLDGTVPRDAPGTEVDAARSDGAVDPLIADRERLIGAVCDQQGGDACSPAIFIGEVRPPDCTTQWRSIWTSECVRPWTDLIQCKIDNPSPCEIADPCEAESQSLNECLGGLPEKLTETTFAGIQGTCVAVDYHNISGRCTVTCSSSFLFCSQSNGALLCTCPLALQQDGGPSFGSDWSRTNFYVESCDQAGRAAADGRCSFYACCYQDRHETCAAGGECTRDCSCVGPPSQYGATSCQQLAELNDADVIVGCNILDSITPKVTPASIDASAGAADATAD